MGIGSIMLSADIVGPIFFVQSYSHLAYVRLYTKTVSCLPSPKGSVAATRHPNKEIRESPPLSSHWCALYFLRQMLGRRGCCHCAQPSETVRRHSMNKRKKTADIVSHGDQRGKSRDNFCRHHNNLCRCAQQGSCRRTRQPVYRFFMYCHNQQLHPV